MADKKVEPATKEDIRALRTEVEGVDRRLIRVEKRLKTLATKDDLKSFATTEDLKSFATKDDLKSFATKNQVATVLDVVRSIDDQLKKQRDIAERVAELEENFAALTLSGRR